MGSSTWLCRNDSSGARNTNQREVTKQEVHAFIYLDYLSSGELGETFLTAPQLPICRAPDILEASALPELFTPEL